MNRNGRLVWNAARRVLITLFSSARGLAFPIVLAIIAASVSAHISPALALDPGALPTGGKIAPGQGNISVSGNQMTVTQQQNKMIANWDTFNIGRNAEVTFVQPNSSSSALNRIADQNSSQIFGSLKANGQVFLLNPSGIVFGPTATVNVGGLVASSLNLSNEDYLSGQYRFTFNSSAGAITNMGIINAAEGGVVALIAPQVTNTGSITAPRGSVVFAAGNRVSLDFSGDGLVNVSVDEAALNAALANQGAIKVDGGRVFMTAQAAGDLMATVVNNTGVIEANSISEKNGIIVLDGGAAGSVSNSGLIGTAGKNAGETGGTIKVLGTNVSLEGKAVLDASGDSGGGTVLVGGNFQGQGPERNARSTTIGNEVKIKADAIRAGNGGRVAVWSDGKTDFSGIISAKGGALWGNGGYAEVSGKTVFNNGLAFLDAPNGSTGLLFLDPTDYLIAPTGTPGANETGAHVALQLAYGNYTIQTSSDGTGNGDIILKENITWDTSNTFTMMAHNDIVFSGSNITAPKGSIVGWADRDGNNAGTLRVVVGTANSINVGGRAIAYYSPPDWSNPSSMGPFSFNDSYVNAGGGKTSYALLNDVDHLQKMQIDPWADYALGKDIDASATTAWNASLGFQPIGTASTPYRGTFDGLGHKITSLYINRSGSTDVGLFGYTSGATIRNVGLVGSAISGYGNVGALVGTATNNTNISNSYAMGAVTAYGSAPGYVGGLVGNLQQSTLANSYSMGSVSGMVRGGLVGTQSGSTITSSYYDADVAGFTGGYGTGATTAAMMQQSTYQGWDFTNTWSIMSGYSYPNLVYRDIPQPNPVVPEQPVTPPGPPSSTDVTTIIQAIAASQSVLNGVNNTASSPLTSPDSGTPGQEGSIGAAVASASGGSPADTAARMVSADGFKDQGLALQKSGDYKNAVVNYREAADLLVQLSLPKAREVVEWMKTAELQDYFQDPSIAMAQRKTSLKEIPQTTAVVYTLVFPHRVDLILVLQSGMMRFTVPIESDQLSREANALRVQLQRRTRWDYMSDARKFYNLIIKPLEMELETRGIDTIVFIPDGALRTVPFAALHDGNSFLIERYAVVVAPSLDLTDPRSLQRKKTKVLTAGLTEPVQGFAPLANVKSELDGIQGLYQADRLENLTFRQNNVRDSLRDNPYSIVHIATHGTFAPSVSESFLLAWDGKIDMNQLDRLMRGARSGKGSVDLLSLSACETAAGDDKAALGLAGVAIKAGSRSVLATLWSVSDQAASELVLEFYQGLKGPGVSKAEALQTAQVKLLDDPRYHHPYYWAPFLMIGNWL